MEIVLGAGTGDVFFILSTIPEVSRNIFGLSITGLIKHINQGPIDVQRDTSVIVLAMYAESYGQW